MFLRGLKGYLPASLVQGMVGLLTLTIFTRLLSPEDYGRYALALGVCSLAHTIAFCWIEAAMARFYPAESGNDARAPELYGTLYRLHTAMALIFLGVCALGLHLWPTTTPEGQSLKIAVGAGLAGVIFRSMLKMAQEQRRSEGRVQAAASMDMLQTAGGFGLGVLLVKLGLKGEAPLIGTGVMAACLLPFFLREDLGRALSGRWSRIKALSYGRYGLPITLSLTLSLGLYTLDRFLIAHFMTEGDVGAYQAGFSLASRLLDVLFIWFGAASVPAMINVLETRGEPALKIEARKQVLLMALVTFPAVAGLISLAPELTQLLIGEALRTKALSVTPLIALGALLAGLNTYYFLVPFSLARKTYLLILAMSVPAIANVALNLLLIPGMGLQGAALAYTLSFAIGIPACWLLGFRATPLPLPISDLAAIAGISAIMAFALSRLPDMDTTATLLIKPPLGILIYGALILSLNICGSRARLRHLPLFRRS